MYLNDLFAAKFQKLNQWVANNTRATDGVQLNIKRDDNFEFFATLDNGGTITAFDGALADLGKMAIVALATSPVFLGQPFATDEKGQKERAAISAAITATMFEFVIAHEIGHIIKGHLGLLAVGGHAQLTEVQFRNRYPDMSPEDFLAFEWDADIFASELLAGKKWDGDTLMSQPELEAGFGASGPKAGLVATSVALLFLIFHHLDQQNKPPEGHVSLHPKSLLRCLLAVSSVVSCILPTLDNEAHTKFTINVIAMASEMLKVLVPPMRVTYSELEDSLDGREAIAAHLKELRPILKEYQLYDGHHN